MTMRQKLIYYTYFGRPQRLGGCYFWQRKAVLYVGRTIALPH